MESKFKEGLYRLTLLLTASTVLLLALMPHSAPARVILVLSGLGMGSVGLGYRRLPALPDSAAPIFLAVLLTTLLWLAPEQHAMWLWGWAAVIAMPQPVLLLLLHSLLAASCLWQVTHLTDTTAESLLTGLLLVALLMLGLARQLGISTLWRGVSSRTRLMEHLLLWSGAQLKIDLSLETTRCEREGSHGELLLLRSPSNCQPALAEALVASTRSYESCYQADGQTLAALLINRNAKEATLRRNTLLASLPSPFQARFVTLAPALSLDTQLAALERQEKPVVVLEENK
ncbi:hypothetical protein DFO67_105216 [Modicisalibacter xianhensis]|uniref:Uncharacterized protein n=1 Tax=Modicisalibacter xianhensis TaxID=442341 RepID=A0A4R8FV78_9GAMM|nr:hypothetical protein [Halomonas xianhensis]TDX30427.1 hypothetical protein DFO67_105216 [Halomonas xianhensis]